MSVESLGDKLKSAREGKGYSYEHVGREINIARRYLEALEEEDFSKFPGEPYLLGFLRNYGEYLGLDVDELLSLYRAIKIQEQPIPVEQLLKSSPAFPKPLLALFIGLPVLIIIAVVAYLGFIRTPAAPEQTGIAPEPKNYVLDNSSLEQRFYQGDTILIPLGTEQFKAELRSMEDPLTLIVPGGRAVLNLSGDTDVDLNGDGIADVRVSLSDYDKNSPSSGAFIRFDTNMNAVPDTALNPVTEDPAAAAAGTAIFTSSNTYPFTMEAQFQGYCMFRWEVDRQERTERYFTRGERLNIPVQNTIRLWASNATAVAVELNGAGRTVTLNLGNAGEVVVIDLRWIRDAGGRYRLTQYSLE
ncbi:MAG: helix-turn-helix domain-containing protein [Spirochaetaceae bacterium]|jgi:cytoskeletal protein RodZ|nr:helix-turn-helix domain-containing protein [Spirochaetaceae bacterium]